MPEVRGEGGEMGSFLYLLAEHSSGRTFSWMFLLLKRFITFGPLSPTSGNAS